MYQYKFDNRLLHRADKLKLFGTFILARPIVVLIIFADCTVKSSFSKWGLQLYCNSDQVSCHAFYAHHYILARCVN